MEVTALKGSSGDLRHFADRIFAECGVRHARVAMIPASAKTKRRPKAYLTIETPVVACPFRLDSGEKSMHIPTKVPSNLH
jgi:NikR C terminal nickel binding domain